MSTAHELLARFERTSFEELLSEADAANRSAHGRVVTYSPKVFIPLTRLCSDRCGYCTFVRTPRQVASAYLSIDEVLEIARAGLRAGCREALFTLGDRPESRHPLARAALREMGFSSTAEYLEYACRRVLDETGLLPHVNAGLLDEDEMRALRRVSVSQGAMLETIAPAVFERGGAHRGCRTKRPRERLRMIEAAGRLGIPFTSGILVGIGETRLERIESLLALRDLHSRYGHLQEIIVQNFLPKEDTRMAATPGPDFEELAWSAAVARLVFGPQINLQVPPNLSFERFAELLRSGINDWGGVSPVTVDHVNPEAAWPEVEHLARRSAEMGFTLAARLPVYPAYVREAQTWIDAGLVDRVVRCADAEGYAREDAWVCGAAHARLPERRRLHHDAAAVDRILARCLSGTPLGAVDLERLFGARGSAVDDVCEAADLLRERVHGERVSYVVTRNINYTNLCSYGCRFCAFSRRSRGDAEREPAYDLGLDEVARRAQEAWDRGATEVCMQGGIHPRYTGRTYLALVEAVKQAVPRMHVHAFSPLEVMHGARTLDLGLHRYLERLRDAGLGTLPGTAAEILDDEVRRRICPDKLNTREWLEVVQAAHEVGLPTTATIMFGHVEGPSSWARHLVALRDLQARTGGFTEFVPLPFVHMEAPASLRRSARPGPTWREVRLMHAVARLALHPHFGSIQASWTKNGPEAVRALLRGGVNDLGGTLMNESISRAAGASHGEEMPPERMEALVRSVGRAPWQRNTLYGPADPRQRERSFHAAPLADIVLTPPTTGRRVEIPLTEVSS